MIEMNDKGTASLADLGLILLLIFLFASPFLIGYLIFSLMVPVGFWETMATLIIMLIVCGIEGTFAWLFAFIIIGAID